MICVLCYSCCLQDDSKSRCIRCKRRVHGREVASECAVCGKHWHASCAEAMRHHVSHDLVHQVHGNLLCGLKACVPEVQQCGTTRTWWDALTADQEANPGDHTSASSSSSTAVHHQTRLGVALHCVDIFINVRCPFLMP